MDKVKSDLHVHLDFNINKQAVKRVLEAFEFGTDLHNKQLILKTIR